MPISIRAETFADIKAIHAVTAAAFNSVPLAELNDRLRADGALLLSHVAILDGEVVGHAAYSLVSVTDRKSVHRFPALGPIAVAPPLQGQGIGSALVRGRAQCDERCGLCFAIPGWEPGLLSAIWLSAGTTAGLHIRLCRDGWSTRALHGGAAGRTRAERGSWSRALPPGICRSRTSRLERWSSARGRKLIH